MMVVNFEDNVRTFVSYISSENSDDKVPEYKFPIMSGDDDESPISSIAIAYHDLYKQWCEDTKVPNTQKARIESLMANNTKLMTVISDIKCELNKVKAENEPTCKFVRMLNSDTNSLEQILSESKPARDV